MMGTNTAAAADRRYSSALGTSPEKPAKSQPQYKTPHADAESPANRDQRNASHVEFSSPAKNAPWAWEPVNPARLKVTGALPADSSRSPYALAYATGKRLFPSSPRFPLRYWRSSPQACSPPSVLNPSIPISSTR